MAFRRNSGPTIPSGPPPAPSLADMEQRVREAMLDGSISADDAQTILDEQDPDEKIKGAMLANIIDSTTAESLLRATPRGKIKEVVWRALNPAARPGATMPDDFEIPEGADPAQGLRAKAEGFIRSRQKELRMRNIAVILGDDKGGKKKGFSEEQRKEMLHDLEGIIPDNEYDALAKYLGERPMPADPTGAQNALLTTRLNTLRTECQPYLDPMADNAHRTASREFYAELGRKIFEDNAIGAGASAEERAILKKHTGVSLLNVMTGIDGDFEKMKREQMRPYETQVERGRAKKLWDWYRGQSIPVRVGVSMAVAAGVGAGMLFVPAFSIPLYFTSLTFGGANYAGASVLSVAGARGGRALLSGTIAPQIQRFIVAPIGTGIRRLKERNIQTTQTEEARNKAAMNQLATGANYIELVNALQETARETSEKMTALDKSHKRWSVVAGLGTGLVVGWLAVPKIANAADAALPSGPGKGYWPDESRHLPASPTAPSTLQPAPSGGSSASPVETPPGPPPTSGSGASTAPKESPATPAPEAGGEKSNWDYLQRSKDTLKEKWDNLWSTITGGGAEAPSEKTTLSSEGTQTGGGKTAGATAPVTGAARESISTLPIGNRGPQGAMIDDMVGKGIPKPKAGTFASQIWENNKVKLAQDPRVIAEMKKYGYTSIDDMARRLHTGGKLKMVGFDPAHTDPASIKNVRIEFDDNVRAVPHPARPVVSQQPTARPEPQPPSPAPKTADPMIRETERQKLDLARRAQADVIADAQRAVTKQQNLSTTGLNNPRWGKDFFNTDFRGKNMTVKDFADRMEQVNSQIQKGEYVDYGDVSGGGLNSYDSGQLNKVAQQLKEVVPPGEQATTTVEQAFQKHSLGNSPPAPTPVPPAQPPASGQTKIIPGREPA